MSDHELVLDILDSIVIAIERIERRFQGIEEADDFVVSDEGIDRLDGIAMMLIVIGEQVKRLDTAIEQKLEEAYPEIDWRGVKGTRDILSHHCFCADAEWPDRQVEKKFVGRLLAGPKAGAASGAPTNPS